jgi:uncharacterized repeat protein (TIGR02543 family)
MFVLDWPVMRNLMKNVALLAVTVAIAIVVTPSAAQASTSFSTISTAEYPIGMDFDSSGNLFIASQKNGSSGNLGLVVVPKVSGTLFGQAVIAGQETLLVSASSIRGVAVDSNNDVFYVLSNGKIYALTSTARTAFGVSVSPNSPTLIATASSLTGPLEFDSAGNLWGVYPSASVVGVLPVSTTTLFNQSVTANTEATYAMAPGSWIWDIAFDGSGNLIYSDGWGNQGVWIYSKSSGTFFGQSINAFSATEITGFSSVFGRAAGIDSDSAGNVFVVLYGNSVYVLSPAGGTFFGQSVSASSVTQLTATASKAMQGVAVSSDGKLASGAFSATFLFEAAGPQTVTFDANGGSGSMVSQASGSSASLSLNSYTKSGYAFAGWNTAADGSGTDYADGATFPFSADDTLYAQWLKAEPPFVAANDAFVQPGDADGASSSTLLLKNAVNNDSSIYNRVSYARFEFDPAYNWTSAAFEMMVSTNSDGASNNGYNLSYTTFNVDVWAMSDASWGDSLRFSSADASTQDWGIDTSTWPWSPEGGTYIGTISIPTRSSTVGQTYSLSNPTLASFLAADTDGKVTFFFRRSDLDNQGNLAFASIENSTAGYHGPRLVAPSGSYTYTIAYDVNGGSGTLPSPGTYTVGSAAYSVAAPSSVTPPSGKAFAGWNSKADGSGTQYSVGSAYSTAASATLYAQFTTNPVVTFASNDGNSVLAYQAVTTGNPTALIGNSFTRTGYTFSGWNTSVNGSGTSYADGANITASSAVTLYAQWAATSSESSSGGSSGGSGSSGSVTPSPTATSTPAQPRFLTPPQPTSTPRILLGPVTSPGRGFDPSIGTRATVGGAPSTVTKRALPGGVSVQTGAFQFGMQLTEPQSGGGVDTNTPSNSPEIRVPTGQSTQFTGGGLLPGSQLQVWLPGRTGGDARELARVPVKDDGTFDTELSFTARQSETPVPIGRQVMQVAGFDENGNQTVVDMTINVSQGPIAPELDREQGVLPDLSVGSSLVTSAGFPTPVTVVPLPNERRVSVGDGSWNLRIDVDGETGVVGGTSEAPVIQVTQDSVGSASGDGFMPGTTASVWMFSDPTLLGTATVGEDGSFTTEFVVDSQFLPVGAHTLQIQGVGGDGFIKAANLGVEVQEPVELTTQSATGLLWWVVGAFVMLLVVFFLVVVVRRRSRRSAN